MNKSFDDIDLHSFFDDPKILEPVQHLLTPVEIPEIVVTPPTPTAAASYNNTANIFDQTFSTIHNHETTEAENTKICKEIQLKEAIPTESTNSNNKKCDNKTDEKIVITNSTVSIILQNDNQSAGKLVTNELANVIKTTSLFKENGVFQYALQKCFSSSCKEHYSILKYGGGDEPDFLGFGLEEQVPYYSKSALNSGNERTAAISEKRTKLIRRKKNPITGLRQLPGFMYKKIVRDVCNLMSMKKKQRRRRSLNHTPLHRKEYYTSSDSESCSSENETQIKRKKVFETLKRKENTCLQALRRSNRILQRKLKKEKRLSKQKELFAKSSKNNTIQEQNMTRDVQRIEENDAFSENLYETPQHSVDSGYSAHIIESDGSEIIPMKQDKISKEQIESATNKRRQTEPDSVADYKKMKLELFGCSSESDSSCNTQSSPKKKAGKKRTLLQRCSSRVRKKLNKSTISFQEPLILSEDVQNQSRNAVKCLKGSSKSPKTPSVVSNTDNSVGFEQSISVLENDQNQNETIEDNAVFKKPSHVEYSKRICKSRVIANDVMCNTVNNVAMENFEEIQSCIPTTSVKLPCDISVKKPIKIVKKECNEQVKTSFKRPNCRSRIPDTPRSPDRSEVSLPLVQPKIIPLEKPKMLSKSKL